MRENIEYKGLRSTTKNLDSGWGAPIALVFPSDLFWRDHFSKWIFNYEKDYSVSDAWDPRWIKEHFLKTPEGFAGWLENGEMSSLILYQQVEELIDIHFVWTPLISRRCGHMRALFQDFIEHFHGHRIWLEVSDENLPAQALYKGLGFSSVGTRPNYYPSKASAQLFSL